MKEPLISIIEERRLEAGRNGRPLGYQKFAQSISDRLYGASLFRFLKGETELQVSTLRLIASWAKANHDQATLRAITAYVLGINVLIAYVDN